MITRAINAIKELFNPEKDYERYRDEFEANALASGAFKGIRFTRASNGDYIDERLQESWVTWRENKKTIDYSI